MYAHLTELDSGYQLRYERQLRHPVERVWKALIDPAVVAEWVGEADIDLVEGGRYLIRWANSDAVMDATISALEPPHLLQTDSESHGRLRWEIEATDPGSKLTLTVTIAAPEWLTSAAAGWHTHLDVLEQVVGGGSFDWSDESSWRPIWERHHERYVELYREQVEATQC